MRIHTILAASLLCGALAVPASAGVLGGGGIATGGLGGTSLPVGGSAIGGVNPNHNGTATVGGSATSAAAQGSGHVNADHNGPNAAVGVNNGNNSTGVQTDTTTNAIDNTASKASDATDPLKP